MAKKRPVVTLADYKQKKSEEGSFDIIGDRGTVFSVPPAVLWPDDVQRLSAIGDLTGLAAAVLGEETFALFVAEGGSAILLSSLIEEHGGMSLGK